MNVGHALILEPDRKENDIFDPLREVTASIGNNPNRVSLKEIQHEGNVMGCQAPENVFKGAKATQVQPLRMSVEHIPKGVGANDLSKSLYRWVKKQEMTGHEFLVAVLRKLNEFFGDVEILGQRFFHEHMFSRLEGLACQGCVSGGGGCEDNTVDALVVKDPVRILDADNTWIAVANDFKPCGIRVTAYGQNTIAQIGEIAKIVRAPGPNPKKSEFRLRGGGLVAQGVTSRTRAFVTERTPFMAPGSRM